MSVEDKYLKESDLKGNYFILEPGDEAERKSIKLKYCDSCYTCRYGSEYNEKYALCENASVLKDMLKYNKERNKNFDASEYQILTKTKYLCKYFSKTGVYS